VVINSGNGNTSNTSTIINTRRSVGWHEYRDQINSFNTASANSTIINTRSSGGMNIGTLYSTVTNYNVPEEADFMCIG